MAPRLRERSVICGFEGEVWAALTPTRKTRQLSSCLRGGVRRGISGGEGRGTLASGARSSRAVGKAHGAPAGWGWRRARARAKPPPGQKRPRARSPCGRSRRRAAPPPGPCWRGPPPDSGVADCAAAGAYPAAKPQGESPVKTQNSVRLAAKTCADPRTSRERSGRAEIIGGTLPSSCRLAASTPSSPPLGRCARSCGVSLVVFHWCIF